MSIAVAFDERALAVRLKTVLKGARYEHTQGVVKTAKKLAVRYGVDPKRVALAAWLHDCAKDLDRKALKSLLKASGADRYEVALPALWHAPIGAYLARRDYGVRDVEVLGAIRRHTTGDAHQSLLQKILFVADYTEPGRSHWPELPVLRRLARRNLDAAWAGVLRHKLMHLLNRGRPLHPRGLAAYHAALPYLEHH